MSHGEVNAWKTEFERKKLIEFERSVAFSMLNQNLWGDDKMKCKFASMSISSFVSIEERENDNLRSSQKLAKCWMEKNLTEEQFSCKDHLFFLVFYDCQNHRTRANVQYSGAKD